MSSYGAIANETMMKKYEITNGMTENHEEILDDFYRNTLRNWGPDKTTLASDEIRTNKQSVGKLNLLHSGNRSNMEPVHNDLFLGLTEKDPRGHVTGPDFRKSQQQVWHRKKNYKNIFTSDADASIPSEGVNQKTAMENIRKAQFMSKDYLKIFETSTDGMHRGYNAMPESKPVGGKVENTNVIADLNDIKNIAKRRDWTTEKSLEVPLGYMSTPDHKFKIAHYGKKGKTADISNTNIRKNNDKAEKDGTEMIEYNGNVITKSLKLAMDNIIRDRKKHQEGLTNSQFMEISKKTQSRQNNKNIILDKTNEAKNIVKSHANAKMMEELNKSFSTATENTNVVKNKNMAENDLIHGKIHQNEVKNTKSMSMDKFILSQMMDKIIQDNDKNTENSGNNKNSNLYSHIAPKLAESMNKSKYNTKLEKNGTHKRNPEDYKFHKYASKNQTEFNKLKTDKEGFDMKALVKKSSDQKTQYRHLSKQTAENNNSENVELDQSYVQNGEKNRNTGKKLKFNMMRHTEIDNDQDMVSDKERIVYSKK
jgi:hypothetical protein